MKAAQHTLPVGFAKSVQKVECFNDMIEILFVGEENEEMVLPCKISFTKDRFIFFVYDVYYTCKSTVKYGPYCIIHTSKVHTLS